MAVATVTSAANPRTTGSNPTSFSARNRVVGQESAAPSTAATARASPDQTAEAGKNEALDEHLAHKPAATGTQGEANRELA